MKKDKDGGLILPPYFKIYNKASHLSRSILASRQIHRPTGQNRESPEVKPQTNGQIIFDKCAKTTNREGVGFSTNGTRMTEYPHEKSKDHYLTPYTKINATDFCMLTLYPAILANPPKLD